jgi:hypothetical protein
MYLQVWQMLRRTKYSRIPFSVVTPVMTLRRSANDLMACSALLLFQGHAVVVEERKKRALILFEPCLALARRFTLQIKIVQLGVEPLHTWLVFAEESRLEAVSVHGRNHWSEEMSKVSDQFFQFLVERLGHQIIVQVTDKVNQAPLLWGTRCCRRPRKNRLPRRL